MPTVLRDGALRFFFFSNERQELAHIHVESSDGRYAKFWLDPVELAEAGLKSRELRRATSLVLEHVEMFKERWNAHFGA